MYYPALNPGDGDGVQQHVHRLTRRQRGSDVAQCADEDVLAVTGGEPLCNGSREQDDGAGKDRRDDAGHVQLQRQIGRLPLVDLVTDLTLGVVDGDPTLTPLDEDHKGRHQNDQRHDDQRRHRVHVAVADQRAHAANGAGQTGHDAGEDDQRDAVAQTPFGDLFAQPHQEHRAGDQRNDRHEAEHEAGFGNQVALRLQRHRDAQRLERGQCHFNLRDFRQTKNAPHIELLSRSRGACKLLILYEL